MKSERFEKIREITEEKIPFNHLLGLKLEMAEEGQARCRFDFHNTLVGNYHTQVLHGGVIASVLDVIGACAVMSTFEEGSLLLGIGTVDMRVDYLCPGSGDYFLATGQVMRPGRILCSTRMELHNDQEELIAIGTAIYRVSRKKEIHNINV